MTRFHFRGCPRCGGDLYLTPDDWQCLQCGRSPRPAAALPILPPPPPPPQSGRPADANAAAGAGADADGFWDFWRRQAV